MAGSEPRRHHIIPESFLARFTDTGEKEGRLFVTDRKQARRWPSKPKGAAHQRDYYFVDTPGVDPYALEKAFGEIEGAVIHVIDKLVATGIMPDGEAYKTLMYFISLMTVRTPNARQVAEQPMRNVLKDLLKKTMDAPEAQAEFEKLMAKNGIKPDADGKYGEYEKLRTPEGCEVELLQGYHMAALAKMLEIILPLLSMRNWCIMKAAEGEFICSDQPTRLEWTVKGMPAFTPPGLGLADTEFTIPLDKKTLLAGRLEAMQKTQNLPMNDVAAANARTISGAQQVFSPADEFLWIDEQNRVQLGGMLEMDLARVKAANAKP